jgi:hypothetical protein
LALAAVSFFEGYFALRHISKRVAGTDPGCPAVFAMNKLNRIIAAAVAAGAFSFAGEGQAQSQMTGPDGLTTSPRLRQQPGVVASPRLQQQLSE